MARPSVARAWTGAAIVAALAVIVVILAVLAMQRVSSAPAARPATSPVAPTPSDQPTTGATETALPTPVASATAPPVVARADERYLAAGTDGVIWRGTAGSCEDGTAPLIERSIDDGVTWTDVTPTYRGITELVSLDDFAQDQADAVASVLDGESADNPCDVRAMRTFSDGAFWEDDAELLAATTYAAPDAVATIVTPGGAIDAPCAEPRSVRSGGGRLALVCEGSAFEWGGGEWIDREVPTAVAVAVTESGLYVAHVTTDCDGVQLSAVTDGAAQPAACQQGVDPRFPLALDVTDAIRMWTGDELLATALPEGAAG
ncbi:hypothetical protein [Microbacterium sp. JZ31]|uniref:hypothetical protein n=1 Tax=Microbacterium sp. JZ31 TaxID=1906274 RepID=UPI0019342187|nr:hypothetical protein [Microbacterium sp. JZ31]